MRKMSELFDIYDDSFKHIGTKTRAEVHREGDWHKVFHCWVIYRDDAGQSYVILQKRSPTKDTFPNKLDVSAAGHYEAGETIQDGLRELHEELGIKAEFEQLISLGQRMSVSAYDNIIDRQIADIFFFECNQPLTAYNYQHEEITGLIALNVEQGLRLLTGEIDTLDVSSVGFQSVMLTLTIEDFIPTHDRYFEKLLVLVQRYFNGEKYLFI